MATRELAQGLASLGRHGDSMLVHMQPDEISGLQTLARANGTSLTINPHTGMPEAFNLGRALKSVARVALPIAAGWALGPGGLTAKGIFSSSLGAGLAVGAGAYALTGDPMYALSSGLGGAGGFGLGQNVSAYGKYIDEIPQVGAAQTGPAFNMARDISANPELLSAADDVVAGATKNLTSQGGFDNSIAGVKGIFGSRPEGKMNYADFLKQGYIDPNTQQLIKPSLWQDVATVGMPVLTAMSQQRPSNFGLPAQETLNYEGPYRPSPRNVRTPTKEETERMRAEGMPEYTYFDPSNPIPGYQPFAEGGAIATGGIRDLYGTTDDQLNGSARLSQDGYGLGRLDTMYGNRMAGGGPVSFEAGGQIPTVGAVPQMSQAAQASYAVPPTNLAEVANIGEDTSAPGVSGLSALNRQMSQATSDPMGRVGMMGSGGMSTNDIIAARTNPLGYLQRELPPMARASLGPMYEFMAEKLAPQSAAPTMQDYIQAATRTQLNPGMSPTGVEQQYFNQVNPQPVQAAEGGIMRLARGGKPSSGGYLDGPGDGMSDSIPATIAGKQPARLADGEFVIPADVVSHLGNGSTKAGAKVLYKMMRNLRKARTGTTKQGKQINPSKFIPA